MNGVFLGGRGKAIYRYVKHGIIRSESKTNKNITISAALSATPYRSRRPSFPSHAFLRRSFSDINIFINDYRGSYHQMQMNSVVFGTIKATTVRIHLLLE